VEAGPRGKHERDRDPAALARRLGHRFADPALLERALAHRSCGASNNERLEFLGDAFLGFVMARQLYRRFPELDEGRLSRLRALLVKRPTLAAIARELELGEFVRLGQGERSSGGWRRESILADAMEAVIGAVLLDGGEAQAEALVMRLYTPRLDALDPAAVAKDAKTRLQELLQARRLPLPRYELAATHGEPHEREFTVHCLTEGLELGIVAGAGSSRQRAEQAAAQAVLERLGSAGD